MRVHTKLGIYGIPFSQIWRLKKICTKTSERSNNLQMFNESYINRGFNEKFLRKEFQLQPKIERNALLEH